MAQLQQCPNCGGYRTFNQRPDESLIEVIYPMLVWMLVIGWVLMVLLLPFYLASKSRYDSPKYRNRFECELCGYEWSQTPGDAPKIHVDPELIRIGEEHRRQRISAAMYEDDRRRREQDN